MPLIKVKLLLVVNVALICSCHHFSGEILLDEAEVRRYSGIHLRLKKSSEIEFSQQTDVLIYRNWQYTGFWNNLDSWKKSQELFNNICADYWKIKRQNITIIEHDKAGKLEYYLKNYKGSRLIIYFVSHQTSTGEIVLHDGTKYSLDRLARLLNSIDAKIFLIYDTCHAELLKNKLNSEKVSVYYGSRSDEEAFDMRPRGQKPSLTDLSEDTQRFIKAAWGIDVKTVSVFGFFLVHAIVNDSYSGADLNGLMSSIISNNRKITKITGMGRYPQVFWQDPGGWGNLVIRK